MAEPPPSLPPPPPPPPPLPPGKGKGKGKVRVAKVWVPKSSNRDPESSIPISIPPPPPVTGFRPYGAGASSFRVVPYGYSYPYLRPPQPQPQPQVDMNMNGFIENRGKVDVDVAQSHTTPFGVLRHGTGVFHPPRVHNRPSNIRGWRNKQEAAATHQFRRSRNASKGNSTNSDGSVKQEECHAHSPPEIGLPQDWTY